MVIACYSKDKLLQKQKSAKTHLQFKKLAVTFDGKSVTTRLCQHKK
jgi:hypothetical protein